MFAGTDTEGSRDGLASPAEFCEPAGLCVACEQQAHFRSSLLSLRKIGGREAKTGNASTVRRLGFVWNLTMFCICVTLHETAAFLHVVGKLSPSTRSMQSTSSATYKMSLHCIKSLKKHCTIFAATRPWYKVKFQACQHFPWPTVHVKEGVNGVDRIATKGEKYYWLPTKREKNYRLPIGNILTDYRHGLTLSIFYFTEKGASCIFPTFLGRNLRYHRLSKFNWKDKKGEKPNICYFDGRHKSL